MNLRDSLESELATAEAHLAHCLTVRTAHVSARGAGLGAFERALLAAGIDPVTADEIARDPRAVPSELHIASTKRAVARLQKRLAGLVRWEARQVVGGAS